MLNELQNKIKFYSLCYANKKIKVNGDILEAIVGQSKCYKYFIRMDIFINMDMFGKRPLCNASRILNLNHHSNLF